MPQTPRISLEQWQALVAVVEAGGYARAAETLHKSQSTITYGVQRIQDLLGVKLFELRGRKARQRLTHAQFQRRAVVRLRRERFLQPSE